MEGETGWGRSGAGGGASITSDYLYHQILWPDTEPFKSALAK